MSIEVARHVSPALSWEWATRAATAELRGLVRNYTGYVERSAEPLARREVPSGDVTLILSPGSQLELGGGSRHTSFVAALHESSSVVEHGGFQEGVEVRLTPLGARALFGRPMHELTNRVVELEDLMGRDAHELVERIWEAGSWEGRFAMLDRAIAARARAAAPLSTELSWAWGRLRATAGRTPIAGLARELEWSHRRLIQGFRESIGLPPKALARVLRFERVAQLLQVVEAPRLAEVAYDCGYYDQAHLNRDFRQFAGTTPSEYLALRLPSGGGVAAG
jgi:AraC-like DNA-binding protein